MKIYIYYDFDDRLIMMVVYLRLYIVFFNNELMTKEGSRKRFTTINSSLTKEVLNNIKFFFSQRGYRERSVN